MRSDKWDNDEKEFEKNKGFADKNNLQDHQHKFYKSSVDGLERCYECQLTREEIRKRW